MRRNIFILVFTLLAALSVSAIVSAQAVTVEVPVTTTVTPPVVVTVEPTVEVTVETTPVATVEATAEATAQPSTATAQAQSTIEAAVTPETTAAPMDNAGYLRFAHFAPDAPGIDVYVNGTLTIKDLTYPGVSEWIPFTPGKQTIAISQTGESASATVVSPADVDASAGTWQTVAVVGSANSKTLQTAVIKEDYSDLLPSTGGFTFFNAVEGSPTINLMRNGVAYFAGIGFPGANTNKAFSSLVGDSGTFDVSAVDNQKPSTVLAHNATLELPENAYTLVALIGTPDNARFFTLVTDRSEVEIVRGLLPAPGQLLEALRNNDHLTAFASALQSAGLSDLLSGTAEYTIFAPANYLMDTGSSGSDAANVLRGYIVAGKYTSKQLIAAGTLTALDGTTLHITTKSNGIFVNNVQVIDVNIAATNGVIYMLDAKLGASQ